MKITIITGGALHYEAGLVSGLVGQGIELEVVGGDELQAVGTMCHRLVCYRNLHGIHNPNLPAWRKLLRVLRVYARLMVLAFRTDSRLLHIQWPYKLVFLDRTFLSVYYKILRKKLVFTAHNVDGDARDGTSTWPKRFSLRFFYRIVDHIIVHTVRMRDQLVNDFGIHPEKISIIPHGVMSTVPETALTGAAARSELGIAANERVLLFFGLISPYKGLDVLVQAVDRLQAQGRRYRLIIAGRVKECREYWQSVQELIARAGLEDSVLLDLRHIPDEKIEIYLKAADTLVLPYRDIFQSGVLFLAYRFGLPIIASDVGSFKQELLEAHAGVVFRPNDPADLARAIEEYFSSTLYLELPSRRPQIRAYAYEHYSWDAIGARTRAVYEQVLRNSHVASRSLQEGSAGGLVVEHSRTQQTDSCSR